VFFFYLLVNKVDHTTFFQDFTDLRSLIHTAQRTV